MVKLKFFSILMIFAILFSMTLPTSYAKEKTLMGVVKAIGSEVKDVKVNDKVVFGKYSGTEVKLEGTEYLILKLVLKIWLSLMDYMV